MLFLYENIVLWVLVIIKELIHFWIVFLLIDFCIELLEFIETLNLRFLQLAHKLNILE